MAPKVTPPDTRFEHQIIIGPVPTHRPDLGNCTLYTGATNGRYGRFYYAGKLGLAHRYAWERAKGPIPNEMTIDHLCRVMNCVNVNHLEVVTQHENNARAARVRTHCANGHEYTPENTLHQPSKGASRQCKKCRQACGRRATEKSKVKRQAHAKPKVYKYDPELKAHLADSVLTGEMRVCEAARLLGCPENSMSTFVSRRRNALQAITATRMKAAMS